MADEPNVGDMADVYRLKPGVIWVRLKSEPAHFWLFLGYIFFEYVRPQGIFPVIDFLPWARLLILGAFFTFLLQTKESKSLSGPITVPLIGFFAVVFLSCVFAFDRGIAFKDTAVLVNWALLYVLFLWIVNSKFRFFLVALLLLATCFKLAQHGFRVGLSRGFSYATWGVSGPPGYFQNAADLGVQMAVYTAWAVAFYFGCRQFWQSRIIRLLFAFAPIAGIGTAIATGQRSTALAFVSMGIAAILLGKNRIRNTLLISAVGLAAVQVMSEDYLARFDTAGTDDTSRSRLLYWERGLEFFRDNPVIGVGYQNWVVYYGSKYPGENVRYGGAEVAHSVPITVAAETGTLGIVFFCSVVIAIFWTNMRAARMAYANPVPFWRNYALALNFGLIGFLAAGVFLSITYYPFLWVQAGLSAALYRTLLNASGRAT